jgi:formamidopyrimidine-DNA glycosylase
MRAVPELPEVEVLVRHLRPLVTGRRVREVTVHRAKSVRPDSVTAFGEHLRGARFTDVTRRGKYLCFTLRRPRRRQTELLIGHLGMTGRMFLQARTAPLPRHAAVTLDLGKERFVFQDTRYFGRLTFDPTPLARLGLEPLEEAFSPKTLGRALARSQQAVKPCLMDQSRIAGLGNIYANEALWVAGIAPQTPAARLGPKRLRRLWAAIREVLTEAIEWGSTVPLNWSGRDGGDGLFYYGKAPDAPDYYEERLRVYDRAGEPCVRCGGRIRRVVLAARSTFYCPRCQRR